MVDYNTELSQSQAGTTLYLKSADGFQRATDFGDAATDLHEFTGSVYTDQDILLISDSKGIKFGAGDDVTFTHDGGTGMNVASAGDFDIAVSAGNGTFTVADTKTLILGKTGASELKLSPHSTAGSELASLINTAGTTDGSDAAGSILLSAVAGGIGLAWADTMDLWAEGGQFIVTANHDTASCIKLHADAGTSQTIQILNDAGTASTAIDIEATAGGFSVDGVQASNITVASAGAADDLTIAVTNATDSSLVLNSAGTGADALQVATSAGGMDITVAGAAAGEDLDISCNQEIRVTSTSDAAEAIYLRANAGTSETIKIHADQGTSVAEGAASVSLLSDAGGVELRSTANLANAINITNDGGTSGTITVFNDQGTSVTEGAASIQLLTDVGGIGIKSTADLANAVLITADGGTSETIKIHADQGSGAGSIELTSDAGGIDINAGTVFNVDSAGAGSIDFAADASNITLTTDGAAEDFTISLAGATDSSLILSSTGTGADALQVATSAGGMDITVAGAAAGEDLDISCNQEIRVTSTSNAAEAIYLRANAGTSETIKIHADQGSGAGSIELTSDAGGVDINAGTVFNVDSAGAGSLDFAGDASNITLTSDGAAEDFTISLAGATDSSLILSSTGTGADALQIATSAGGMDITVAGAAAGEDLDISCNQEIRVTSTSNAAEAIYLRANAGTSETIKIHADQGSGAGSIELTSDAGGVDINAAGAISLDSSAGSIDINVVDGQTVKLGLNGGVEQIIAPHGTAGSELYSVINTAGTTDGTDAAGAILLSSVAGGISLLWHDAKDLWMEGGKAVITANENGSEAIKLHADAGAAQTIQVINDAGTVDGTAGAGAIDIEATAGGISLLWNDGKDLWAEGGRAVITANEDAADCIKLHADAGTSQTINVLNDAGTSTAAIALTSTAGGITLSAGAISQVHDFATTAPLSIGSFDADGDYGGTVIKYSPGADDTLTVGGLYFLHTDGTWNACDADAVATGATQLLGIGLGNARSAGVLIKGFIRIPSTEILNVPGSNATPGLPLYVSTTAAHIDFTAPSATGDFVRIVGYAIQDSTDVLIYFDPDNTYVEIS